MEVVDDVGVRLAVLCPPNEDENDWLAMNVVDFFNRVTLLYSVILDRCTEESCPSMTAGNYIFFNNIIVEVIVNRS